MELQGTEKPLGAVLKLYEDGKIKYNHLKLVVTQEYKALESNWEQRISKAQLEDSDLDNYTNWEAIYILRNIVEKFIKEFYRNFTQGHNGAMALVVRLQEEYIIHGIWGIIRKVISKCPDCQRNKSVRYKPYGML